MSTTFNLYDEIKKQHHNSLSIEQVINLTSVSKTHIYRCVNNNLLISNRYKIEAIKEVKNGYFTDKDKLEFKNKWNDITKRLNDSGVDLSKIKLTTIYEN